MAAIIHPLLTLLASLPRQGLAQQVTYVEGRKPDPSIQVTRRGHAQQSGTSHAKRRQRKKGGMAPNAPFIEVLIASMILLLLSLNVWVWLEPATHANARPVQMRYESYIRSIEIPKVARATGPRLGQSPVVRERLKTVIGGN